MTTKSWVLEERICLCGCGKPFRVLPTSTARYASFWHEHGIDKYYEIMGERKPKAGNDFFFRDNLNPEEILISVEETA